MTIRETILVLCARPEGATNRDMQDETGARTDSIVAQLNRLEAHAMVHRSRGANGKLQFFTTRDAAVAHTAELLADKAEKLRQADAARVAKDAASVKRKAEAIAKAERAKTAEREARAAARLREGSAEASKAWRDGKLHSPSQKTTTHQGARPPMLPGSDRFRDPNAKKPGPPDLMRYTAGASKIVPQVSGNVDVSRAIVTIAPRVTHDQRYQVDPASRPFGAGFAACGIGRSVTTGQGWGQSGA